MSRKCTASAGFTLVEVIIVIVITVILAGLAVPKFIDLQKVAEEAKLYQAYSSMLTVIHVSQGISLTAGADLSKSKKVIVDYGGETIVMKYGLPTGNDMVKLAGLDGYKVNATGNRVIAYAGDKADKKNRVIYRRNNKNRLELRLNGKRVELYTR